MIVFAWSEFPQYAARCVGAFVERTGMHGNVAVVATKPRVPVAGMEKLCNCPVRWVDGEEHLEDSLRHIDHLFVSGWSSEVFHGLCKRVRSEGGRVYAMVDNNFPRGLRNRLIEIVKAARFRLMIRNKFDGFFVPGRSGRRLLRFYGVPDAKIKTGLYSADERLFTSKVPICTRRKSVIYVGQICERKNVEMLCNAFAQVCSQLREGNKDWTLELYGCGPLESRIIRIISALNAVTAVGGEDAKIVLHPFLQPEELSVKYADSRVFVLPSRSEHWGLVVHEAALSGCILLTSTQVGAAEDFVTPENGRLFNPLSLSEMTASLKWAMELDDTCLMRASQSAANEGRNVSLAKFVQSVSEWVF